MRYYGKLAKLASIKNDVQYRQISLDIGNDYINFIFFLI